MTSKRWTDADVERLVSEIKESMANGNLHGHVHSLYNDVLKPFLPDPEEDLIEAMLSAWKTGFTDHPSADLEEGMRAVLAVVKEKGLPQ